MVFGANAPKEEDYRGEGSCVLKARFTGEKSQTKGIYIRGRKRMQKEEGRENIFFRRGERKIVVLLYLVVAKADNGVKHRKWEQAAGPFNWASTSLSQLLAKRKTKNNYTTF